MLLLAGAIVWLLAASQCLQVHSETFTMTYNPNMFDDQYIGCSEVLEKIMPNVLHKEKENKQFKEAWISATELWYEIKENAELPEGFQDEYGIALLTFTNNYPVGNPICQQLNGNLSIAGTSQDDYMEKFHFKALHFYLTRALQMLKPNCDESHTTYRGSPHSFHVRPLFKFGSFTPSSLKVEEAQVFGTESLFQITTCFGARIGWMSFFPSEAEVLIPPTEKFLYVTKENSFYVLRSTGEMCSYFNCAYLGDEKRKDPFCRSASTQSMEETQDGGQSAEMSAAELQERMSALEILISQNHLYWNHYRSELENITQQFSEKGNGNKTNLYASMKKLAAGIKSFTDVTKSMMTNMESMMNNEGKIIGIIQAHDKDFKEMKNDLKKQQAVIDNLSYYWLLIFGVTGASVLVYNYGMRRP